MTAVGRKTVRREFLVALGALAAAPGFAQSVKQARRRAFGE